jgi:peptide/nickel transport system permease protein
MIANAQNGLSAAADVLRPSRGSIRASAFFSGWRRSEVAAAAIIVFLFAVAFLAPLTGTVHPNTIHVSKIFAGPSLQHPFGFDSTGRDVLSRLIVAYRSSIEVALGSVVAALLLGTGIGVTAGYFGGLADNALMRPVDLMLAFPPLLFAVSLIAILGRGSLVEIIAIAAIYVPLLARVSRSSAQIIRRLSYVDAAKCRGSSHAAILVKHVLPNALGPSLALASVLAGLAVQIEAALSYLGLGAQPPTASLGVMLADGQQFLQQAPWAEIFPGLGIALTAGAFLIVGNALRRRIGKLAEDHA